MESKIKLQAKEQGSTGFSTASWPGGSTPGFSYDYQPGSPALVATVTGPVHTVANQWTNPLGALAQKENKVGATNVSTYQYGVNDLGQRASVNTSGTAFATAPADWLWRYNLRGELASAQQTNTAAASRFYEFDGIGNRQRQRAGVFADAGGTLTGYTANALNQYTAIGTAPAVAPAYDFDGNMTSGPLPIAPSVGTALVWDGENRLREVGAPVRYLYDALGRRVMKTIMGASATRTYAIYDGWNLLAEYTGAVHTTGAPPAVTLQRSYAWGTDLSGSAQGAGGVGGLLAAQLHTGGNAGVYYPTYDGNGNVSEYLDNNGNFLAHYEYGPFGELLVTTGEVAAELPFRFSTKYQDAETGLLYYGYRYYDPVTGRWLSRDPLQEQAFFDQFSISADSSETDPVKEESMDNAYRAFRNNAISYLDPNGLLVLGIYGYGPADKFLWMKMSNTIITAIANQAGGTSKGRSEDGSIRSFIREGLKKNPKEPIILFGYSRGAIKITEIAKWILENKEEFPCPKIYLIGIDPVTLTSRGPVNVPSGVEHWTNYYQKNGWGYFTGVFKVLSIAGLAHLNGTSFSGGTGDNFNLTGQGGYYDEKGKAHFVNHAGMPGQVRNDVEAQIDRYKAKMK